MSAMDHSTLQKLTVEELYEKLNDWGVGGDGYKAITDEIGRRQMRALLSLVEKQVKAAEVLERQTDTLINLTRSLKVFTVVVVVFTVGLFAVDAFHLFERREANHALHPPVP